jgi:hypothetical protein
MVGCLSQVFDSTTGFLTCRVYDSQHKSCSIDVIASENIITQEFYIYLLNSHEMYVDLMRVPYVVASGRKKLFTRFIFTTRLPNSSPTAS